MVDVYEWIIGPLKFLGLEYFGIQNFVERFVLNFSESNQISISKVKHQ